MRSHSKRLLFCATGVRACERLEKVVMRVDQAGEHHMTGEVEDLIRGLGQLVAAFHPFDESIPNEQSPARDFPSAVVHRDENFRVFHEQGHTAISREDRSWA